MGPRERWRSDRAAFLVLVGGALGVAGNAAWIPLAGGDPGTAVASILGILFSALAPLALRGKRPRTGPRFGLAALAATIVVLLTPPGIVGGGLALVGALAGFLATDARASP